MEIEPALNNESIPTDWSASKVMVHKIKHYAGNATSSIFPAFHSLFSSREQFKDGISAVVITKDDIWLDEYLKSIENYVDELVLVDSSSEEYLKRNIQLVSELRIPEKKTHCQGTKQT